MSRRPDFDELVGEVEDAERDRLRRVHDLLLEAGPPAELPPHLEAGPTLAMTLGRRSPHRRGRRLLLLAATVAVLLAAFLGGYITGNDRSAGGRLLRLQGTAAAPHAQASLRIENVDAAGNWPMQLAVLGLPRLPRKAYYEVYLVRAGEIYAPCGAFLVKSADEGVSVHLNAPYEFRRGDTWVITRQRAGDHAPGPVVLRPVT